MRAAIWLALFVPAMAGAQAINDPMRPPNAFMAPEPAKEAPRPPEVSSFVLQSVMLSPTQRAAIINGQLVKVGEHYGDAELIEVAEGSVVLRGRSGTQVLRMNPGVEKRNIVTVPPMPSPSR